MNTPRPAQTTLCDGCGNPMERRLYADICRPCGTETQRRNPLPKIPTYIAYCCREWIAPYGHRGTTCGLCGQRPTYLRPDPDSAEV